MTDSLVPVDVPLGLLDVEVGQVAWRLAVDAAGVGAWEWDLATRELRWDDRLLRVFGVSRESWGGTIEAFNALVHPDDVPRVTAALERAVETCGEYAAEYRVLGPEGLRWVAARGRALAGADGKAARVVGAAFDTTDARDTDARVARVLEAMPSAFYQLDPQWRFAYLNNEAERLLGADGDQLVGRVVWEAFPATVGSIFETSYRGAVATGEPVSFDAYYPAPLDGWYEVRAWPSPDGLAVYFNEVTERYRTQERMARVAAREALVDRVTQQLVGTLDGAEALRRLGTALVPDLGDWVATTLVEERISETRYAVLRDVGQWGAGSARADLSGPRLVGGEAMASLVATDRPLALPAEDAGPLPVPLPDELPAGATVAVLALRGRDRLVGLVTVVRRAGTFDEDDLLTLGDLAVRAGLALDNARLFAEQRDLAEGLQRSLLTDPPSPPGLQVAVRYAAAAQAAQVGGDWYDAFGQDDGGTVLVVGDVVGHDAAAAAAMGQVRSLLRAVAVHDGGGPAEVLRATDRVLRSLGVETTATVLVVRLDPVAEPGTPVRARWSTAGHPPPVLVDGDGTTTLLDAHEPDLLLGWDDASPRAEGVLDLAPGATLLLYTDGLVERRGEHLDVGLERLREELGSLVAGPGRGGGPRTDLALLCEEVVERMVPGRREDDVALVAVRPLSAGEQPAASGPGSPAEGLRAVLPAHPTSVSAARRLVAQEVDAHAGALAPERRDAAILAVSELATNALVHAGTDIRVCVTACPTGVRVEVRDGSAHSPVPRRHSVTAATGRGLRLVDASVDRWDIARHRDGKTVWFEVGRPPGAASPDDAEPAPEEDRSVRVALLGVPLAAHWVWQEQAAGLLREHLLLTLEEDPGAMERHAAASDALDLLREVVPEARPGEEHAVADVVLQLSTRSVQSMGELDRALCSAREAAGAGRMLASERPTGDLVGSWLCAEVARQGAGRPPRAWVAAEWALEA
ncbi:MAG: SpoIIE family protein phosphatase [Nocardioides sp.]